MMKWANFLHFYQPANQQPDILKAVVIQSYRPILKGIKENKKVRITININGSLLELLEEQGHLDVLEDIKSLVKEGRLEITGSAKYHALLPLLTEKEIIRQINLNTETLKKYLGEEYEPKGFFPPEMAYTEKLPKILDALGFKWMILDEIAKSGQTQNVDYKKTYKIKNSSLFVFFRERRPSNLIMSAMVRHGDSFKQALGEEMSSGRFLITGMDGETFGHHRPGLEKTLFELFRMEDFDFVQISDLLKEERETEETDLVESTWASSEEDIKKEIQFLSWRDPENQIHSWQWELVDLALNCTYKTPENSLNYKEIRAQMDKALASDHLWWASAKPWWSLEEIEHGAFICLDLIRKINSISPQDLERARVLYEKIVSTSFDWKRSGKIYKMAQEREHHVKIPFKERTLEKGGREIGVYEAFISMMNKLEEEARDRREYEQAILWRDAVYKIENKSDIYDLVNAIDLLRTKIPNAEIEATLDKYTAKYKEIRGGQPEQRQ